MEEVAHASSLSACIGSTLFVVVTSWPQVGLDYSYHNYQRGRWQRIMLALLHSNK
jgi:hypothetical protein